MAKQMQMRIHPPGAQAGAYAVGNTFGSCDVRRAHVRLLLLRLLRLSSAPGLLRHPTVCTTCGSHRMIMNETDVDLEETFPLIERGKLRRKSYGIYGKEENARTTQ